MKVAPNISVRLRRVWLVSATALAGIIIAAPAFAQHDDGAAPKPDAAQIAAYKAAFAGCRDAQGEPLMEERRREADGLIDAATADISAMTIADRAQLAEDSLLFLLPTLPQYPANFDALSQARQVAITQETGIGRLDLIPLFCEGQAEVALPVVRWLADHPDMPRTDRHNTISMLAMVARYGDLPDQEHQSAEVTARAYFLKSLLLSTGSRLFPFADPRFWSDGIDDSIFGNIERQGLRQYFTALMDTPAGYYVRLDQAEMFARSDPDTTRKLLMSNDPRNIRILFRLENNGLIEPSYSDKDLSYWHFMADQPAPIPGSNETVREYMDGVDARIIANAAAINGGTLPVSTQRPTLAESYGPEPERPRHHADLANTPVAMRALVAPNGKTLLVEKCGPPPDRYVHRLSDEKRYPAAAYERIARLPPPMRDGTAVFGWVILPSAAPAAEIAECAIVTAFAEAEAPQPPQ